MIRISIFVIVLTLINQQAMAISEKQCKTLYARANFAHAVIERCWSDKNCGSAKDPESKIAFAYQLGTYANSAIIALCKKNIQSDFDNALPKEPNLYKLSYSEIKDAVQNKIVVSRATGEEGLRAGYIDPDKRGYLRVSCYNHFEDFTVTEYVIEVITTDGLRLRYSQPDKTAIKPLSKFIHLYTKLPKLESPVAQVNVVNISGMKTSD